MKEIYQTGTSPHVLMLVSFQMKCLENASTLHDITSLLQLFEQACEVNIEECACIDHPPVHLPAVIHFWLMECPR